MRRSEIFPGNQSFTEHVVGPGPVRLLLNPVIVQEILLSRQVSILFTQYTDLSHSKLTGTFIFTTLRSLSKYLLFSADNINLRNFVSTKMIQVKSKLCFIILGGLILSLS